MQTTPIFEPFIDSIVLDFVMSKKKCNFRLSSKKQISVEYKKFIEELQKRLGKNKKSIDALMSDTLQIIKEHSVMMDSFSIQGFGTFEPRKKAERISVNPATGKRMLIPPKIVLTFKPGTIIKNKLREKSDNEQ